MGLVFILILVVVYQAIPFYGKYIPELPEATTDNENGDITDLLNKIKEQNLRNVHFKLYSDLEGLEDVNLVQLKSVLEKKGDKAPFAIIIARNDMINENFGTDKEQNLKEIKESIIYDGDKSSVALKNDTKKEHANEDQASKKVEKSYAVQEKDSHTYNDNSFPKEVHKVVINEFKSNLPVTEDDIQDKLGAKSIDISFNNENKEKEIDVSNFNFDSKKQAFEDLEAKRKGNSSSLKPFKNKLANIPNTLMEYTASLNDTESADILRSKQKNSGSPKLKIEDEETGKDKDYSNDNQSDSKDTKHSINTDFAQVQTERLKIDIKNNTDKQDQTRQINSDGKILLKELMNGEELSKEHSNMTIEYNLSNESVLQPESMMGNSYEDLSDDKQLIDQTTKDGVERDGERKIVKNYINIACKTEIRSGTVRENNGKIPTCYIHIIRL